MAVLAPDVFRWSGGSQHSSIVEAVTCVGTKSIIIGMCTPFGFTNHTASNPHYIQNNQDRKTRFIWDVHFPKIFTVMLAILALYGPPALTKENGSLFFALPKIDEWDGDGLAVRCSMIMKRFLSIPRTSFFKRVDGVEAPFTKKGLHNGPLLSVDSPEESFH